MRKFIGLVAVCVVLVALVIGCAPTPTPPGPTPPGPTPPGPTPPTITTIKIGGMAHWTGPYTETAVPINTAWQDYNYWWNKEVGKKIGVHIEHLMDDCRTDPTLISEIWMKYRDAGVVACTFTTSAETNILIKELEKSQIPAVGSSCSWWAYIPTGWAFNGSRNQDAELFCFLKWLNSPKGEEHEKDKPWMKEGRKPSISYIGWDTAYGRSSIGVLYEYCRENNWPWAGAELLPYVFATAEAPLKRLVANGADYVMIAMCGASPAVVYRDAYRLRFQERGITVVGHHGAATSGELPLAEEAGEAVTLSSFSTGQPEENFPAWIEMQKVHKERTGKEYPFKELYWDGYGMCAIEYGAVRILVEDMGMDPAKITGKDIYDIISTGKAEVDPRGAWATPFGDYPGGCGVTAAHASRILKWHWNSELPRKGYFDILSDWIYDDPDLWLNTEARRAELIAYEKEALKGPWTP